MVISNILSIDKTQSPDFAEPINPSTNISSYFGWIEKEGELRRDPEVDSLISVYKSINNPSDIIDLLINSESIEKDFSTSYGKIKIQTFIDFLDNAIIKSYSSISEVKVIASFRNDDGYKAYIFTDILSYNEKLENKLLDKYYDLMKHYPKDKIEIVFFDRWTEEKEFILPKEAKLIYKG